MEQIINRESCHIPACIETLRAVHAADGYPERWPDDPAGWLAPADTLAAWIAGDPSLVTGHVLVGALNATQFEVFAPFTPRAAAELAVVRRLFVHPAYRSHGIAQLLLSACVRRILQEGRHAVLETMEDSLPAIRLYEGCGWRRLGTAATTWSRLSGKRAIVHLYEFGPAEPHREDRRPSLPADS
jgi:GNAT superfamily N-acetyltransferase